MKFLKSLPKEKLQKVVLAAIGSVIALGVVGNFFIAKELGTITEQTDRAHQLSSDIAEIEGRQKEAAANEGLREQLEIFVASQQQSMVTGDAFAWVVRQANLLAEKRVIQELALSPQGKTAGAHFQIFVTHVAFGGSYDEVCKFIRDMENHFPLSQIRNLTLNGSEHGCQATLEIGLAMRPADVIKSTLKPKNKNGKKSDDKKPEVKKA